MQHKWHHWATGNYLLDYEDPMRGYGGVFQAVLIASQRTGLPSVIRLTAEQHSFGASSEVEIHVKAEGLADSLEKELYNALVKPISSEPLEVSKLWEVLERAKFSVREDDILHFEAIIKVNKQTIYCHYLNKTTFKNFAVGNETILYLYT